VRDLWAQADEVPVTKQLIAAVAGFALGYWVVTKAAPALQAKIESLDIDTMWAIFNDDAWEEE